MVLIFSHNNRSLVANWWWTVDKTLLACISILIVLGILLTFSARQRGSALTATTSSNAICSLRRWPIWS